MKIIEANYPEGPVKMYMDASFADIADLHEKAGTVIITDENIFALNEKKFAGYPVIKIKAGETNKTQIAADRVIAAMLEMDVDKSYLLVGVGGGLVTDITGYVASVFKRGIRLALVPTSVLSMTDAAIGGKNGVNVGMYKNMVGTTYRPQFILYDWSFLDTLPEAELINGFAEIIKHACIKDAMMFDELQHHGVDYYLRNRPALAALIEKNMLIKTGVVIHDEHETGERYILNFGHTFGHALENLFQLPHGHAISAGMVIAAKISEQLTGFKSSDTERLIGLLKQYRLPVSFDADWEKVLTLLEKDKKRRGDSVNFVLLRDIGHAVIESIAFPKLHELSKKLIG